MDKIRVSAKTKDEAITKALIQLGTTSDRLDVNVLVQGSSGLFGIGAKPWIIEAYVKEENVDLQKLEEEVKNIASGTVSTETKKADDQKVVEKKEVKENAPSKASSESVEKKDGLKEENTTAQNDVEKKEEPKVEQRLARGGYDPVAPNQVRSDSKPYESKKRYEEKKASEPKPERVIHPISEEDAKIVTEKAEEFLKSVLSGMNMEVSVHSTFHHETNELMVNLEGPDMGILIGKRGQTLDSLQYLCSLVVNKEHKDEYIRIKLDTEDYRKRREQTLRNLAKNIAFKVKRTHKPVSLEPMNPYERRIIHSALQNNKFVETYSEGNEPYRHIVVTLKRRNAE